MKIVKINKSYKHFHYGFTHVIKFDGWSMEVRAVEKELNKLYGPAKSSLAGSWAEHFARVDRNKIKKYYIYLRDESAISMLFLKGLL